MDSLNFGALSVPAAQIHLLLVQKLPEINNKNTKKNSSPDHARQFMRPMDVFVQKFPVAFKLNECHFLACVFRRFHQLFAQLDWNDMIIFSVQHQNWAVHSGKFIFKIVIEYFFRNSILNWNHRPLNSYIRIHVKTRANQGLNNDFVEPRQNAERCAEWMISDHIGQIVERRFQNKCFWRRPSITQFSYKSCGNAYFLIIKYKKNSTNQCPLNVPKHKCLCLVHASLRTSKLHAHRHWGHSHWDGHWNRHSLNWKQQFGFFMKKIPR